MVVQYRVRNVLHLYRLLSGGPTTVHIGVGHGNRLVADAAPLGIHRVAAAGIGAVRAHCPSVIVLALVSDQRQGVVGGRGGDTDILVVQGRSGHIIHLDILLGVRLATSGVVGGHHKDGLVARGGPHRADGGGRGIIAGHGAVAAERP